MQDLGIDLQLLDYGVVDNNQINISELLQITYLRGQEDALKKLETTLKENLQQAAQASGLLKEKLENKKVHIHNMYLKVISINQFRCLVIVDRSSYFNKQSRESAYRIGNQINSTNNRIDLDFNFMAFSENIEEVNITSDGYYFKHEFAEV